ncbi:MAG: CpaE family protein [Candidatus Dormibacteria bacterium]
MIRVLVADGSERIRANLLRRLAAEEDITVCGTAEDGEQALQEALHLVPDIAVLDAGLTGLDGVQTTEMLAEYAPQAGVILMSMESGSELFRRAMLAGAREVLQKPFAGDDLVAAIHRVHAFQARKRAAQSVRQPEHGGPAAPDGARRRDGRMITIVSGKGGVGKSIIATNLALVLNRPHPGSVVLVDLSLQFGDVAALLAMTPDGSIAEFAASDAGMTDRHVIQQALSLGPQGLTVLAAPPSPELADYVTTAHLRSLVAELRATFQLVVADTTSQLSEITLEALENSDHIVLVTDFSVTSVKNTRLIMSVIGVLQVDPERIVVVANHRDAPLAGGMDRARIEDFLRHPVAAEIPYDATAIGGSVSTGVPVVIGGHSTPATAAFERLASALTGDAGPESVAEQSGKKRSRRRLGFARD